MHGLAPEFLKDLIDIKQNNPTYSLRSNDSSFKLNVPSIKTFTTLGDRCFMIAALKAVKRFTGYSLAFLMPQLFLDYYLLLPLLFSDYYLLF